jgi:molecular chaperone DnaJ
VSVTQNVIKADYYEVLGVSRDSNDQEIKSSYRRLAMQYHPDRNPGDRVAEDKFKECSEAYQVLSDPDKRAAYDRFGHAGVGNAAGGGFSGQGMPDMGDIFGDFFGEMFNMGGTGRASRAQRGRDLRMNLTLEFEEAAFGKQTEVKIRRMEACTDCSGTGTAGGKTAATCSQCGGRGQVRFQQGFFSISRTCPQCSGTGSIVTDPCRSCSGEGRVSRDRTVPVTVPAGVEDGTRMRYQQEGDAGKFGGPAGDFFVVLSVKEHEFFERDGTDLHCVVPVSFVQAALGAELSIPTLEGESKLKMPEGTQSGKVFRLKGKGIPVLNGHGKGDLMVRVMVQTPTKLSRQQRDLLKQLGDSLEVENKPHSLNFLSKMKDLFS